MRAGTALAAAMLERLAASGCRGIFATHLHQLIHLTLNAPRLEKWRMEVERETDPLLAGALRAGALQL